MNIRQIIRVIFHKYPWIRGVTIFLVGVIFGSGGLWSYLDYGLNEKKLYLDKINQENTTRAQQLSLLNEILENAGAYVNARDEYIPRLKKDESTEDFYQLQNEYLKLKSKMIKLISDYNVLEANLAITEGRPPEWFLFFHVIPPPAPYDVTFGAPNENGTVPFNLHMEPDQVYLAVSDNLKKLYALHNWEYPSEDNTSTSSNDDKREAVSSSKIYSFTIPGKPEQ